MPCAAVCTRETRAARGTGQWGHAARSEVRTVGQSALGCYGEHRHAYHQAPLAVLAAARGAVQCARGTRGLLQGQRAAGSERGARRAQWQGSARSPRGREARALLGATGTVGSRTLPACVSRRETRTGSRTALGCRGALSMVPESTHREHAASGQGVIHPRRSPLGHWHWALDRDTAQQADGCVCTRGALQGQGAAQGDRGVHVVGEGQHGCHGGQGTRTGGGQWQRWQPRAVCMRGYARHAHC